MAEADFNNIRPWLLGKLEQRKISTSRLTLLTKYKITNATIFRWYSDVYRPTEDKLDLVCKVLSAQPIIEIGEPPRYEEVPLREALEQFTPRVRERRRRGRKGR